jgi:peptidyl-prolyl cis-trans isomerase A (cyclophilin A)
MQTGTITLNMRAVTVAALFTTILTCSAARATIIRFVTTSGNIDFRLYDSATPSHVANILAYLNSNRYDGTFIHRSAKNFDGSDFVIQGGGYKILSSLFHSPIESGWTHISTFGTVQNEPGISNLRGTLALAKGSGISSGTSEWFINLNDNNTFLDQPANNQFTVFGRVIRNTMNVVDTIAHLGRVNASVTTNTQPPQTYNGAFNELPVLNVPAVQAKQDVDNTDVVLMNDAIVLNYPKGDYDFSGKVDAADYTVWKNSFGSKTAAEADGNGNGIVDAADYTIWRDSFGQMSGPGSGASATVPEPGTIFLLLSAVVSLLVGSRRRIWAQSPRRPGVSTA